MATGITHIGAVVQVQFNGTHSFTARQLPTISGLPPQTQGMKFIDWNCGLTKVTGHVNTQTGELFLQPTVAGIHFGILYGNLRDGIVIKLALEAVSGVWRFFLMNGNEIWTNVNLKIMFDGFFNHNGKIMSF